MHTPLPSPVIDRYKYRKTFPGPTQHMGLWPARRDLGERQLLDLAAPFGEVTSISVHPSLEEQRCVYLSFSAMESSTAFADACRRDDGLRHALTGQQTEPVRLKWCRGMDPAARVLNSEDARLRRLPCLDQFAGIPWPAGLRLLLSFLSEDEERLCKEFIYSRPWDVLKNRRVQHYGFRFSYDTHRADLAAPCDPIPDIFRRLIVSRLAAAVPDLQIPQFDQLTVNEYEPGQGINRHVDTADAFDDVILSLSLLSPVVMEFVPDKTDAAATCCLPPLHIDLPPRSLLMLAKESRYQWQHGIAARKVDRLCKEAWRPRERRLSVTLRKVSAYDLLTRTLSKR